MCEMSTEKQLAEIQEILKLLEPIYGDSNDSDR